MAALSSSLFSFGVIFVALGFAAHVGYAVMLANGRRLLSVPALAVERSGAVRTGPHAAPPPLPHRAPSAVSTTRTLSLGVSWDSLKSRITP